jgi:hypothetical protein
VPISGAGPTEMAAGVQEFLTQRRPAFIGKGPLRREVSSGPMAIATATLTVVHPKIGDILTAVDGRRLTEAIKTFQRFICLLLEGRAAVGVVVDVAFLITVAVSLQHYSAALVLWWEVGADHLLVRRRSYPQTNHRGFHVLAPNSDHFRKHQRRITIVPLSDQCWNAGLAPF